MKLALKIFVAFAFAVSAQIPQTMLFQGQLAQDGVPTTGKQGLAVSLCDRVVHVAKSLMTALS